MILLPMAILTIDDDNDRAYMNDSTVSGIPGADAENRLGIQ